MDRWLPSTVAARTKLRVTEKNSLMFRKQYIQRISSILISLLAATSAIAQTPTIDFVHEVVPILKQHCSGCHVGQEIKGGFSLNSRSDVVESGMVDLEHVNESRLLELISSNRQDEQMPPSDRPRLSSAEVDVLRNWLAAELPWNADFSFGKEYYDSPLRPRRIALPPTHAGRNNPIDRILDKYLIDRQLEIPPKVDDQTFLRRATLDLIGLVPTFDEVKRFSQDGSPDKR